MMRAAEETIVVADSTKFGHQSLAHLAAPKGAAPGRRRDYSRVADKLRAAGITLHVAEPERGAIAARQRPDLARQPTHRRQRATKPVQPAPWATDVHEHDGPSH